MAETPDLFARLYDELHAAAAGRLATESDGHQLHPADLLHDVYLRMARAAPGRWASPEGFYAVAVATMRRVLIDRARGQNAVKRGGSQRRIMINVDELVAGSHQVEILDVERVLDELAGNHPEYVRVVELRFFGGMSERQTAEVLQQSVYEVRRAWKEIRDFMRSRLT